MQRATLPCTTFRCLHTHISRSLSLFFFICNRVAEAWNVTAVRAELLLHSHRIFLFAHGDIWNSTTCDGSLSSSSSNGSSTCCSRKRSHNSERVKLLCQMLIKIKRHFACINRQAGRQNQRGRQVVRVSESQDSGAIIIIILVIVNSNQDKR